MIVIPSPDVLRSAILAYFAAYFSARDLGTASYFGQWARTLAEALLGIYQSIRDAETGVIPSSATASARLTEFAVLFGLPDGSGVAGNYGRLIAVAASGGAAPFVYSGSGGLPFTLSAGQVLTAADGVTQFQTTADVTWAAAGTVTGGAIVAITKGTVGNLSTGVSLSLVSPPAGVSNSVALSTGLTGGLDLESDSAVLARILSRLQNPPKGGTAHDWDTWAEGIPGIAIARCYPIRNGTGTVDVVLLAAPGTGTTTGQARAATSGFIAAVQSAFDTFRLVCVAGRRALAPYQPAGAATAIVVRPIPSTPANAFQFDSTTGGPYTVSDYNATTRLLTFSGACAGLNTAVNTNHQTPRIQVIATGAELPQESTVTAYNNGTHVATIDKAFPVSPANGDSIYASGPMVAPIAAAILAQVNSLGPSRASGFADPTDSWNDTLRVAQLERAVLDAVDANGNALAVDLNATPTIDGGTSNKQAADDGTNAPQLLYVKTTSSGGIRVIP